MATHQDDEHPWPALCDLAMTSPDFDVVYRMNRGDAIESLSDRLDRHGHRVSLADIEAAYDDWPPGKKTP